MFPLESALRGAFGSFPLFETSKQAVPFCKTQKESQASAREASGIVEESVQTADRHASLCLVFFFVSLAFCLALRRFSGASFGWKRLWSPNSQAIRGVGTELERDERPRERGTVLAKTETLAATTRPEAKNRACFFLSVQIDSFGLAIKRALHTQSLFVVSAPDR